MVQARALNFSPSSGLQLSNLGKYCILYFQYYNLNVLFNLEIIHDEQVHHRILVFGVGRSQLAGRSY